jgi:hypothetical protein
MMKTTTVFSQELIVVMGQLKPRINPINRSHLIVDIQDLNVILLK